VYGGGAGAGHTLQVMGHSKRAVREVLHPVLLFIAANAVQLPANPPLLAATVTLSLSLQTLHPREGCTRPHV
jgi:hypothetical protein